MKIKVNSELSQTIQDIDFTGSTAANSELVKAILLLAHPVGSYYWSSDSTSPATLFGGTWTQIKDKFIIAVGDSHTAGTSYGSNTKDISHTHSYAHTHGVPGVAHKHSTGNHTLTTSEMPRHNHGDLNWSTDTYHCSIDSGSASGLYIDTANGILHTTGKFRTGYAGEDGAHNHGDTGNTTPSATTTNSQSTSTSGSGGSTSLDITPACIAAYCWRRTA